MIGTMMMNKWWSLYIDSSGGGFSGGDTMMIK